MKKETIPISKVCLGPEEVQSAEAVLLSGHLREGRQVEAFEAAVCRITGARYAVAASSGTAALHLSYRAILEPGDEVLTTPFTFISTASMILHEGARPVFCDIDPQTLTIDPKEIERRITPKTRAICGVHLFGNTCDILRIQEMVKGTRIKLVWDAAQAFGSRYRGRDVAAFPDIVCFSFYPTKNLTTGEGGMVTTQDRDLAEKIRLLKRHGAAQKYEHRLIGFNYRMTEMAAAIGIEQLGKLPGYLETRAKWGRMYREAFEKDPLIALPAVTPGCAHSYNYFSILLRPGRIRRTRDQFLDDLQQAGIQCAVHYPIPLHKQPCFRSFASEGLPCAEDAAQRILALPMHPFLSEEEVARIIQTVKDIAQAHRIAS